MADSKIKKVTIPKSKLPAYSGAGQEYLVRYRIVSEDKNRTSHWSPQYKLAVDPVSELGVVNSVSLDSTGAVINLLWNPPSDVNLDFDIYVKWGTEDYKYLTSVKSPTHSLIVLPGYTKVRFAVQVPTFPKSRFDQATLFESSEIALVV